MSNRLKVHLSNRPDLVSLFKSYLRNRPLCVHKGIYNGDYCDLSDEDYDTLSSYWDCGSYNWYDDEVIFPYSNNKVKSKRGHRGRKNRIRNKMYVDDNDSCLYDNMEIWFYTDYHNRNDRLEFNNFNEFTDFCGINGYSIPKYIENEMLIRGESHCCVNPHHSPFGELEIISSRSYGDMFYEACENDELNVMY